MSTVTKGTKFPAQLVTEMFNLVKGHSSIAKMVGSSPIPFNGADVFTFNFDNEVSIVGETAEKPAGDATVTPVTIRPIKVVYQSRVSDEFLYAAEEVRLQYLKAFSDAFAKKIASGLDVMIMHGVNPATGSAASTIIGNNHLDYVTAGSHTITYGHDDSPADANIDEALALVDDPTGVILGKTIRTAIANLNISGARKYPDFAWGATPATLGGMTLDSNKTVEANSSLSRAYVGDFNAIKWGFAKDVPLKIIEYGDPDGQGDLQNTNEVVLRSEVFVGWGILDNGSFAKVAAAQGE